MSGYLATDKVLDIELTKRCAEAMGLRVFVDVYGALCIEQLDILSADNVAYDPLHDDAQAMALVKRLGLNIGQLHGGAKVFTGFQKMPFVEADSPDLNRAIVECVAKMQANTGAGER